MVIKEDVLSILDLYDTFFLDVYGVLYDGTKMFDHILYTMKQLKDNGKKIIIISNTTQIASDAKIGYSKRGIQEGIHFDYVITSGEFVHQTLIHSRKQFANSLGTKIDSVKCMFMGNANIFDGTNINKSDSYDADFIYVGIPRVSYGSVRLDDLYDENNNKINIEDVIYADWANLKDSMGRQGTLEYLHLLEICLKRNKTLLVANPDIFAHGTIDINSPKVPIFTQGSIGKYYERMGGKVVYFGKPYKGIFDYAKQYTDPNDKIVMIGDTPWTDILGANIANIDSALVMTGVSLEFANYMDSSLNTEQKLDILINKIGPKMSNIPGSMFPKHLIRQFAHKL